MFNAQIMSLDEWYSLLSGIYSIGGYHSSSWPCSESKCHSVWMYHDDSQNGIDTKSKEYHSSKLYDLGIEHKSYY